ncbi:T9SS type A sorting domain-containing protein [Flavobacterium sp. F372]|uniref:T9SS type A sorting domain-containing protein n=1 Tax=Flavobacterium bernardetii TaxID=2813823 RepID=A0ABR7IUR5_9FLAO|nr:T9SS type A sorting domain-containing protein [Flavobacterium bernardetii]MBC5833521.1 T9SS type A sorting domain-containing protein [Flavobacterium bernardetii]NHF68753.1 T9SS type A sorting domain-containing protein [Flavobacterium bernardetii]
MLCFFKGYSQQYEINLSPEGKLETVYDNRGNLLKLKDILIDAPKEIGYLKTTNVTCSTTSYFNLYFEPGCGMDDTSNPTHNARRAVICKVFEDISNFITSPLSTTGNKVNIWVRNIANESAQVGTLGLASSFYIPYSNNTNTVGGILDGEIWKTIHLGVDSYTNVLNGTNLFYHGKVAFNFNDSSINWNTNLSINSPSNLYDLYTVILHEVVHSLGFGSFINQNGASIDPSPYYSRYDTFLRTNSNIPLLTIGSCSMYDISFNSAVSPNALRPGCTLPNNINNGVLNNTTCNDAIKYVGSSTVPVYTPTCFEQGSSLSHFEDMLFPTCTNPNGNDNYFVLSNVNIVGKTKRYLKPEERNVLCDIGYNVKTTFGVSSTIGGFYNYGGTACAGINVAGLNDGINSNGDYTFVGNANTNIVISGATILNNDISVTGFECLQDISAVSTLSATSGTSSTSINFSSATTGLHILRYVPINGTKRGNITYIYLYIRVPSSTGGCSPTASACNLVMNGDFEQFSAQIIVTDIRKSCGWDSVFQSVISSSASGIFLSSTTTHSGFGVPCNWLGNQSSNNNVGNNYAGIFVSTGIGGKQHIYTTLNTPLQANTNYQLSFDVSLADGFSHWASNLQAFLHRSNTTPPSILAYNSNGDVSIVNNATDTTTQLISPTVTRNTNGWDTISFNFTTTTGGEQFLYLGLLNNATLVSNTPATTGIGGCNYQSTGANAFGNRLISYYIDNVSLIPTNGAKFDLPASICSTQTLTNLTTYLSSAANNGVFSGTGVTNTNGVYAFNATIVGVGVATIGYTFTNASGCSVTLYDTINVTTTATNSNTVDAVNDNLTIFPIDSNTGGTTPSVYVNDLYNNSSTSTASLQNVTFSLISPISILGATINNYGHIFIPPGTFPGTYTLNYNLASVGNCSISASDTASVQIKVSTSITPQIVAGIRTNGPVWRIVQQNTGKILITGNFSTYNNIYVPMIARLNTNLTLDTTFQTIAPFQVPKDIAVQTDNKILLAANYNQSGVFVDKFVRLLPDGNFDIPFNANVVVAKHPLENGYTLHAIAVQTDGKILLGGMFYYYNGAIRNSIVRINSDGTLDTSFIPIELNNSNGYKRNIVRKITIQPDGKILLLGYFSFSNGVQSIEKQLIRLNANGSLDTTFLQGSFWDVNIPHYGAFNANNLEGFTKTLVQPDGKIILVGPFSIYNGNSTIKKITRLLPNGTIDTSFTNNAINTLQNNLQAAVVDVILEPVTNKLIICGYFSKYGSTNVNKLIRLNTNGQLDPTFSIGTGITNSIPYSGNLMYDSYIGVLKQQPDGKIIVGGNFTTFNGLSATNITRIYGSAGVQARSSTQVFYSEPEIDTNPNYNSILLYPNPSNGIFNIDLTQETETYNTVSIFNILGEKVVVSTLIAKENNTINLSHLPNGCYFAKLDNQTQTVTLKLIKN